MRDADAGNYKIVDFFLPEKGFAGNGGKIATRNLLENVNTHISRQGFLSRWDEHFHNTVIGLSRRQGCEIPRNSSFQRDEFTQCSLRNGVFLGE